MGLVAITIAVIVGVTVGTIAAVGRGGVVDWLSLGLTLIGISLPSFVTAAVLLIVFAADLKWFPIGGWGELRIWSCRDSRYRSRRWPTSPG